MSKNRKRKNRSNLYENDFEELLYTTDDFFQDDQPVIVKTKNLDVTKKKPKVKEPKPVTVINGCKDKQCSRSLFIDPISSKCVGCDCNKCKQKVSATLVHYIFNPSANLGIPFVYYECKNCGHSGNRSVNDQSMDIDAFEKYYFS